MKDNRECPSCHRLLPPDALEGLCPECLMKAGFGTGAAPPPSEPTASSSFKPPTIAEMSKLFPQWEIVELLGQGGMGAVYKARQPALDRWIALKVLPPQTRAQSGFEARFNREAKALARLNHPHIVAVHEFGQAGGMPYLVMEYVDGVSLRQMLRTQKLAPAEALAIVPQICEALQFAHDEGVVHRDIKPENILLDKKGQVKIADFGVAKIVGSAKAASNLTDSNHVVGTPHYMAPEQVEKPQSVDHRADIFSLGVVFYEMLTGELPLGKFAPPSRKVHVDVRLDEVVLRSLEKEPERRYQQASQVKTEVETIAADSGSKASRLGPAEDTCAALGQLRLPALGLMVASLSGPFIVGFLVTIGRLKAGAWMFWPFLIQLVLTALAAYGALKARRVEAYRSAILGGIAGCVVSFLNLLCLPFAVWLLAVLTRPSVKHAFALNAADGNPAPRSSDHRKASPEPEATLGAPRSLPATGVGGLAGTTADVSSRGDVRGRSWKLRSKGWLIPAAGAWVLLVVLLWPWPWAHGLLYPTRTPGGTDAVVLEKSELYRLPGSGPEEVADLSDRLVTQADLEALAAKPRLKRLDLHDSSFTDEDLKWLAGLKALEWLDLSATLGQTEYKPRLTDAGLAHLATFPRLRTLILHGNPITDAGLVHLKALPNLQRLQLGATQVTGEGLHYLPHLIWIRLDGTPITDDGLRHLQAAAGLEQLYLDETGVGDVGLKYLTSLKRLRLLNVHDTQVTPQGVAFLKQALPEIIVGLGEQIAADVSSPVEMGVAADQSPGFLPAHEVVFGNRQSLQDCFLVLESGRLLSAPAALKQELVARNQWHPGEPVQALAILDWLRSNHVDLMARTGSDGLTLVDGMGILMESPSPGIRAFDAVQSSRLTELSAQMAQTLADHTNQQPQGLAISWFDPSGSARTWAFRTRAGHMGVLEILEPGGQAGSMKIRYKLAAADTKRSSTPTPPADPVEEQHPAFHASLRGKQALDFDTGQATNWITKPPANCELSWSPEMGQQIGCWASDRVPPILKVSSFSEAIAAVTEHLGELKDGIRREWGTFDVYPYYFVPTDQGRLAIVELSPGPQAKRTEGWVFRWLPIRVETSRTIPAGGSNDVWTVRWSLFDIKADPTGSLQLSSILRLAAKTESVAPKLTFDRAGETMQNIVSRLRDKFFLRLCFENLDFDREKDAVTLGQALQELEQAARTRSLSTNEATRLAAARRLLAEGNPETMLFDVGARYEGRIEADSLEALLDKLTIDTLYTWGRLEGAFVIYPRGGSQLDYLVSLSTRGLTVEQAVQRVLEQKPGKVKIGMAITMGMPVREGVNPMPWLSANAPSLELNQVSAMQALCRVTGGASPQSVWELGGYKGSRTLSLLRAPLPRQEADAPGFTPVFERIVDFDSRKKTAYLDLDTGQYIDPGTNYAAYGMKATPAGVDLKASALESDTRSRMGINLAVVAVSTNQWEATPAEVRQELALVQRQGEVRLGASDAPQTYFFQTSEGSQGILQLEPVKNDPSQVHVRWKLLAVTVPGSLDHH